MLTLFGWYFVNQNMNMSTKYFVASSNYYLFLSFFKSTASFLVNNGGNQRQWLGFYE